jgi:hypothetical protein
VFCSGFQDYGTYVLIYVDRGGLHSLSQCQAAIDKLAQLLTSMGGGAYKPQGTVFITAFEGCASQLSCSSGVMGCRMAAMMWKGDFCKLG